MSARVTRSGRGSRRQSSRRRLLRPIRSLANPAAVKRAYESGGFSLLRGTGNFVKDLRSNRGCDHRQSGRLQVLLHGPLSPGRSFVEHAVTRGLPYFVISWRNGTADQRDWGLETYASAIDRVLDVVAEVARSDEVKLISLCAGGITTATVLSHLAATGDPRVHSASFGVTLLDFDVSAPIGMTGMALLLALAAKHSSPTGVLDAASLSAIFTWNAPERSHLELLGQQLPHGQ